LGHQIHSPGRKSGLGFKKYKGCFILRYPYKHLSVEHIQQILLTHLTLSPYCSWTSMKPISPSFSLFVGRIGAAVESRSFGKTTAPQKFIFVDQLHKCAYGVGSESRNFAYSDGSFMISTFPILSYSSSEYHGTCISYGR
jgi:hypothetical protein